MRDEEKKKKRKKKRKGKKKKVVCAPRVLEMAANSARNLPKCLPVGQVTSCNR